MKKLFFVLFSKNINKLCLMLIYLQSISLIFSNKISKNENKKIIKNSSFLELSNENKQNFNDLFVIK